MATGNINKIVNSRLKPFVISKNTTDIINSCISKIYRNPKTKNALNEMQQAKQTQQNNSSKLENQGPIRALRTKGGANLHAGVALPNIAQPFEVPKDIKLQNPKAKNVNHEIPPTKQDKQMQHAKTLKSENKAPLRVLRALEKFNKHAIPKISRAYGSGSKETLLNKVIKNNKKKATLPFIKALAKKDPKFKPSVLKLCTHRFASNVNSSNAASFLSRSRAEDRRHLQNMQWNSIPEFHVRKFNTGIFGADLGLGSVVPNLEPARNQQMASSTAKGPIKVSAQSLKPEMQYGLMMIDNALKARISLRRKTFLKIAKPNAKEIPVCKTADPMDGWKHPPVPDIFVMHTDESNTENSDQQNRIVNANKEKQFDTYDKKTELINADNFSVKRVNRVRRAESYKENLPRLSIGVSVPIKKTPKNNIAMRNFTVGKVSTGRIIHKPKIKKPSSEKVVKAKKPEPIIEPKRKTPIEPTALYMLATAEDNRSNNFTTNKY